MKLKKNNKKYIRKDLSIRASAYGMRGSGVNNKLWPDPSTASSGMRSDGKELEGLLYKERNDFAEFTDIKYSDAIAAVTGRCMEKDDTDIEFGEDRQLRGRRTRSPATR